MLTTLKLFNSKKTDKMRRVLDETLEELGPVFKPPKNQGPMVTELRFIWTEIQVLLEDSAYVGHKIPISQQNEDDRNAFTVLRKKFDRSKKFITLNSVKPAKPRYDDTTSISIH